MRTWTIVVDEAVIDIADITLARNENHEINVNDFRKGLQHSKATEPKQELKISESSNPLKSKDSRCYLIKRLRVKLDSFVEGRHSRQVIK